MPLILAKIILKKMDKIKYDSNYLLSLKHGESQASFTEVAGCHPMEVELLAPLYVIWDTQIRIFSLPNS